ncbi:MAG: hypothetical protein ACOYMA_00715 [Bacteroidia bacterium]
MKKILVNDFINKASTIHNNKYAYIASSYLGQKYKLKIICPIHGEFFQFASNHLKGNGCKLCSNEKITTTQSSFKDKANKIHNKYTYDKVVYINNIAKIIITCITHGDFLQTPACHLRGRGCPKCCKNAKVINEDFMNDSKKIHGDVYDYSKCIYSSNNKVCIICKIHGEFLQKPYDHKNGRGCPKCGINKTKTSLSDFIKKSNEIHNKYDYSKVDYKNVYSKVIIICPVHNEFLQTPAHHLSGRGCKKCSIDKKFINKQSFIKRSNEIHNSKYSYDNIIFINLQTNINIKCHKHGMFSQLPASHIKGAGCKLCFVESKRSTTEEFIKKAISVHGDKYDYSLINYTNRLNKVAISCKVHGTFLQKASSHLLGNGCSNCANTKGEEYCRFIFEKIFNYKFKKCRPNFLKYKLNLELDGYCEELSLAFEYQGPQHYRIIKHYYMNEEKFNSQKERDLFKKTKCKELSIKLIEIPYFSSKFKLDNLKDYLRNKFEELNINIPESFNGMDVSRKTYNNFTRRNNVP